MIAFASVELVAVVLFGLLVGSFLNVCVYRLPLGLSPAAGRSFCPDCRSTIAWYDNIPLASFILLRGSCRACRAPIPSRYPLLEIITGLLALATFVHSPTLLYFALYFLFLICPLLVVTFIDIDTLTIPDKISIPGIFAGIAVPIALSPTLWKTQLVQSLLGIAMAAGFLFLLAWYAVRIRKKEGMGGGDIKLAAMLGAFFGPRDIMLLLLLAALLGLLIGGLVLLVSRQGRDTPIPFGPFLALGALLSFFFHDALWRWLALIDIYN